MSESNEIKENSNELFTAIRNRKILDYTRVILESIQQRTKELYHFCYVPYEANLAQVLNG